MLERQCDWRGMTMKWLLALGISLCLPVIARWLDGKVHDHIRRHRRASIRMMKSLVRIVRLYLFQAWYSYRSLFAWSTPFSYMTSKFGYPLFSMMMFVFIGKFVGFTDPSYIVLGNILLMPITNGLYGISMTIGNERQFGALSYLLAALLHGAPLFRESLVSYSGWIPHCLPRTAHRNAFL